MLIIFMTLEKVLSFKNSAAFVKAYNVIKIFPIIIFLQGRNKQTRKISSLRNSFFSFPWKIHTLHMKYIGFLLRLYCFLSQFTDIHSGNFMLNCISQGYDNLHTLCLHRMVQVKSCLLTENDTMMCLLLPTQFLAYGMCLDCCTHKNTYMDKVQHSIESPMRTGNGVTRQKIDYILLQGKIVSLYSAPPPLSFLTT